MINKTIEINVSPQNSLNGQEEIAGVMCEHNATELKFILDRSYIDATYKYYLEFVSAVTVSIRTDYLPIVGNAVTFTIPAEISSLLNVDCYFNVVKVTNGTTEMLIKPARINLDFCKVFDANNDMLSNYDFSINALLDAIKKGTFKGDKGDKGIKGDKGDKGDKGESAIIVDAVMSDTSNNPVQNKIIKKYVDGTKGEITVNTPIWKIQPTFTGELNQIFKKAAYENDYFYITLKNADNTMLPANQFKLTKKFNSPEIAVDQIFTLPNLNNGTIVLTENMPISFNISLRFDSNGTYTTIFDFSDAGIEKIEIPIYPNKELTISMDINVVLSRTNGYEYLRVVTNRGCSCIMPTGILPYCFPLRLGDAERKYGKAAFNINVKAISDGDALMLTFTGNVVSADNLDFTGRTVIRYPEINMVKMITNGAPSTLTTFIIITDKRVIGNQSKIRYTLKDM